MTSFTILRSSSVVSSGRKGLGSALFTAVPPVVGTHSLFNEIPDPQVTDRSTQEPVGVLFANPEEGGSHNAGEPAYVFPSHP